MQQRQYLVIDQKSFYATVECVARGLDPMEAKVLCENEIHTVVNFLREQQTAGIFTLGISENSVTENYQEQPIETNETHDDIFGDFFGL